MSSAQMSPPRLASSGAASSCTRAAARYSAPASTCSDCGTCLVLLLNGPAPPQRPRPSRATRRRRHLCCLWARARLAPNLDLDLPRISPTGSRASQATRPGETDCRDRQGLIEPDSSPTSTVPAGKHEKRLELTACPSSSKRRAPARRRQLAAAGGRRWEERLELRGVSEKRERSESRLGVDVDVGFPRLKKQRTHTFSPLVTHMVYRTITKNEPHAHRSPVAGRRRPARASRSLHGAGNYVLPVAESDASRDASSAEAYTSSRSSPTYEAARAQPASVGWQKASPSRPTSKASAMCLRTASRRWEPSPRRRWAGRTQMCDTPQLAGTASSPHRTTSLLPPPPLLPSETLIAR
mmetsp:Transcript_3355/g.11638  ORF Transcript_3355/g.11638 Transcript_3355/m.11638 type:complete len:353 (+) Transcript_3355:220-1278(+)